MGMDLTGKSGNYFRANVWSWRPLHELVKTLNVEQSLGLDLEGWEFNDGEGLASEIQCNRLARALENWLNLGYGRFECPSTPDMRIPKDGGAFGAGDCTPYRIDRERIEEFVKFLKECGGSFEIW